MIALGRAMQEEHHQMTFFLKLQETELESYVSLGFDPFNQFTTR